MRVSPRLCQTLYQLVIEPSYGFFFLFSYYLVYSYLFFFFLRIRPPPKSPLFPYPTLFRSRDQRLDRAAAARVGRARREQQDVDVGAGVELRAPVAAHRHQSPAGKRGAVAAPRLAQHRIDEIGRAHV